MKCRVEWFKISNNHPKVNCFLSPFLKMHQRNTSLRKTRTEKFQILRPPLTTVPTPTETTTGVTIPTEQTTKSPIIKLGIGRRFQWDRLRR